MYYIQETYKPSFIHKKLNIINLEDNKIILPINEEMITDKKAKKYGKIISDYDIDYINEDIPKNDKFKNKDIYEAKFYKKQPFEDIMKKMEKDKVSIKI